MAVAASSVSVGTSATKLAENTYDASVTDAASKRFLVKNVTATAAVFLGPAGVTTGNGFQWDVADGPLEVELEPGESIFGIVASASQVVHSLGQGR